RRETAQSGVRRTAGAKPARSSAAPEPNESRTKPDYTRRRTAIDRDNRAVEGNACERRQPCSLADLRKGASPFGYPRERVFRQAARVRCGSNCHTTQRLRHVRSCTDNELGFYYARRVISSRP